MLNLAIFLTSVSLETIWCMYTIIYHNKLNIFRVILFSRLLEIYLVWNCVSDVSNYIYHNKTKFTNTLSNLYKIILVNTIFQIL